jgi:integrase
VLSADEVVRFLDAVPSPKARTALTAAYAAGPRASAAVSLEVGDIDGERMVIRVALGGHSGAVRPAHDLREPLQPLAAVPAAYDGDIRIIDSSSIRVHQHAANGQKNGPAEAGPVWIWGER